MEKHGVTFRDYACASANLAAGMSVADVCGVLGIEEPLWAEVQDYFNNNMANIEPGGEEMLFYSTVFTNPKQGKFANVESAASGPEVALGKYPEWEDFIKMENHVSVAGDVGIDVDLDKEYGISIAEYAQLSNYWGDYFNSKTDDDEDQEEKERVWDLHNDLTDKWEKHFKKMYKDKSAGLADDVDF